MSHRTNRLKRITESQRTKKPHSCPTLGATFSTCRKIVPQSWAAGTSGLMRSFGLSLFLRNSKNPPIHQRKMSPITWFLRIKKWKAFTDPRGPAQADYILSHKSALTPKSSHNQRIHKYQQQVCKKRHSKHLVSFNSCLLLLLLDQ